MVFEYGSEPARIQSVNTSFHVSAEISSMPKKEPHHFRDCAEILQSGVKDSGIYSIRLHNSTQDVKVVKL